MHLLRGSSRSRGAAVTAFSVTVAGCSAPAVATTDTPTPSAFVRSFSPAERATGAESEFQLWLVSAPSSFGDEPSATPPAPVPITVLASAADHFRLTPRPPAAESAPEAVGSERVAQWHQGPVGGHMSYVPRAQAFDWGSVPRSRGWWGGPLTGFGSMVLAPGLTGGGVRHISVAYSASQSVESAMQREQWIFRGGWFW